jgi:hypothetical protein
MHASVYKDSIRFAAHLQRHLATGRGHCKSCARRLFLTPGPVRFRDVSMQDRSPDPG